MKQQPDRRSGHDRRTPSAANGWLLEDVRMTRGFMLAVVLVTFAFFAFGAWSAVETVQGLRNDDCQLENRQRAIIRDVAHDLVDNDRFLVSVANRLSDNGLPPEFTEPLQQRWAEQDTKIDTYAHESCT